MIEKSRKMVGDQSIQSNQYKFPYHYVPQFEGRMYLSRYWGFASSYVAAINIVVEILNQAEVLKGSTHKHIDVGCGDGALIWHLSNYLNGGDFEFHGVDIDAQAVEWARIFNPNAKIFSRDLGDLAHGLYNSASLIEVLEHIPPSELEGFLKNVTTLIRPGGLIIVTVPSVEKPVSTKHYQHFSFESILNNLDKFFDIENIYGFERHNFLTRAIEKIRSNRCFRLDAPMLNDVLVRRLMRRYERLSGCGRILVVCCNKN